MLQIALWKRLVIWFLCIGGLLLALPNAFYSRVESFNDAKLTSETAEGWSSFLPSSLVNLGLDLRGGRPSSRRGSSSRCIRAENGGFVA